LIYRYFKKTETFFLQNFPDDVIFENKRCSYRLFGNEVPVHRGEWIGRVALKYFN
jgi:site-specific DNA-cytosine methylase